MLSVNRDSFISSFSVWIFFPGLIVLARKYSAVLNNSAESGHPCLVPHFRKKSFSLSPLSVTLTLTFHKRP
jgi:hypothetical protein